MCRGSLSASISLCEFISTKQASVIGRALGTATLLSATGAGSPPRGHHLPALGAGQPTARGRGPAGQRRDRVAADTG